MTGISQNGEAGRAPDNASDIEDKDEMSRDSAVVTAEAMPAELQELRSRLAYLKNVYDIQDQVRSTKQTRYSTDIIWATLYIQLVLLADWNNGSVRRIVRTIDQHNANLSLQLDVIRNHCFFP